MKKNVLSFLSALFVSVNVLFAETVYVADENLLSPKVSVINTATNAVVAEVTTIGFTPFLRPYGVGVSQDGSRVAVTDRGTPPCLYLIDGMTYAVTAQIIDAAFSDPVLAVFTPDMSKVVMTDQGGDVFIIDTMTLTVTTVMPMLFPAFMIPVGVVISLDGSTAYVADRGNANVYVIDIATASVIGLVTNPLVGDPFTQSLYLALSSDGTFSYLTDFFGAKVFKIDMTAMPFPAASAVVTNGVGPAFVMTTACAVTPDNAFVYVSDFMTNYVYKINTTTSAVTNSITDAGFSGLTGVTVIPDGTLVYVCSNMGGGVFSIDTMTNVVSQVTTVGFSAINNPGIVASTPASPTPPSSLQSPRNLSGSQTKNDFGVLFFLSATLTWRESLSAGVTGYNIYRDGVKIASVGSSVLQYIDNNAPKGMKQYAVTAFNASGSESAPVDVQVK